MAKTIEWFMTDPTHGLMPYLRAKVGGAWNGFTIRPYSFDDAATNLTGYVVLSESDERQGRGVRKYRYSVAVGKLFAIAQASEAVQAANFAKTLTEWIDEWATCKCPGLSEETATRITGPIGKPQQRSGLSSDHPNAYWIPITRLFEVVFID